ncbi:hypothetical protein COY95_03670 [Candidatus Woesearchaeota archaeon CG_4_10_14_0_8_um_filter_47_5]|nr:MAG: hypothetical protein COY95_03670 [Candidatus Woesearchaeota archaeon CG_4_10_14_0_8_um_filter_47_5]
MGQGQKPGQLETKVAFFTTSEMLQRTNLTLLLVNEGVVCCVFPYNHENPAPLAAYLAETGRLKEMGAPYDLVILDDTLSTDLKHRALSAAEPMPSPFQDFRRVLVLGNSPVSTAYILNGTSEFRGVLPLAYVNVDCMGQGNCETLNPQYMALMPPPIVRVLDKMGLWNAKDYQAWLQQAEQP